MTKILAVAAHDGNALAVAAVLQQLAERGADVAMILQDGQSAHSNYETGQRLSEELKDIPVFSERLHKAGVEPLLQPADFDAVVTAMSPVVGQNLEIEILQLAQARNVPVYGVEEVPAGRFNPGWRDKLSSLTGLFAPMSIENFEDCPEIIVGSPALDRWRGLSVAELNASARKKLGIGNEPVIYFFPSPEREAPTALHVLGSSLTSVMEDFETYDVPKPVFVLNRHRRELGHSVSYNGGGFRSGLKYISEVVGLKVFDNSEEYAGLPAEDERAILSEFQPLEFLTYSEMLAVTANNGLAVTFFGTDGLVVAPYLANQGIISLLWLDPTTGGRVLQREKQLTGYNLSEVLEVYGGAEALADIWREYVIEDGRDWRQEALATQYPFPEQLASVLTAERILADLQK